MHRSEALRRLNAYRVVRSVGPDWKPIAEWEIRAAGFRTPLATIRVNNGVFASDVEPLISALAALCERAAPGPRRNKRVRRHG